MDIIPTRVHGILDYVVGVLLIIAPWIFGFSDNRAATTVPVVLGIGTIVYSLMTDYELGIIHVIPMRTHLWIDFVAGAVLLLSPWLFRFHDRIRWPHVVVGILEIAIAAMSQPTPSTLRNGTTTDAGRGRPGVA